MIQIIEANLNLGLKKKMFFKGISVSTDFKIWYYDRPVKRLNFCQILLLNLF